MRIRGAKIFGMALLLIGSPAFAAESKYLCKPEEQVVFGCSVGKKWVSICASAKVGADSGYLQYRFGTQEKIEFLYPAQLEPPRGRFFYSHQMYSGGGAGRIRFNNQGYDYLVFDSMVRTNLKAGQPNNPAFDAGVMTRHNGKTTSLQRCKDDGFIHTIQGSPFTEENWDDGIAP